MMTWGTLGQSKDIQPLLVRLYDSHRLYQLAGDKQPEARAELSHIVSGLLDMGLRQAEKELIADILINLMRQAEKDLRLALAERLSVQPNAPLRLILFMAQDDIGVADTVLRNSPVLNDLDLLYIIQSKDADYWRSIAHRHQLNEPVIDALTDTRDIQTACTLAENAEINLSTHAIEIMADIARNSKELARPLMSRQEIPESLARTLYEVVGKELERTISSSIANEMSVLDSVKDILIEFSTDAKDEFEPTQAMMKAAQLFADKGQLSTDLMMKTITRGQIQSFIAQISCVSGVASQKTVSFLRDPNGQGLAVICKSIGFKRDDYVSVYLMTQKMRPRYDAVTGASEMSKAVRFFETLGPDHITRLISQYKV